jgi:hypothetical protein
MNHMRISGTAALTLCLIAVAVGGTLGVYQRKIQPHSPIPLPQLFPPGPVHMERPYGMAPVAFDAYVRACVRTGIHPLRVGQTIGDHPRSVGYHKRDGVLRLNGQKYDYTAAIDIGAFDLQPAKIDRFVRELSKQGFAAWYRHGPRWKNGEHIHAVYAFLPMKYQLRGQVRKFLREENPPWEKKWKRSRFND